MVVGLVMQGFKVECRFLGLHDLGTILGMAPFSVKVVAVLIALGQGGSLFGFVFRVPLVLLLVFLQIFSLVSVFG